MKKFFSIFLATIILVLSFGPVVAQAPSTFESTVAVTNLTNTEGTISLTFYYPDGSKDSTVLTESIGSLETKLYTTFPIKSGFEGALVISSSVPIASSTTVIGKNSSNSPMNYASYVGVSVGSETVFLPLLMDSNYGYNTRFSVQNTTSAPVDVSITYSDGYVVGNITNLEPGASVTIDNQSEGHLDKKFSAVLQATGAIAAAVVQWSDGTVGKELYSSNGFTPDNGATNPVIPMVNQNNYGFWTAIPILNLGDIDTEVTLTYFPTKVGDMCTETLTIPAKTQVEFGSYAFVFKPQTPGTTCVRGSRFVGSALVTANSTNQTLIGLMNQGTTIRAGYEKAGAMMSLNPALATPKVVFPETYQWFGPHSWWSSITIVNVSGAVLPAADVTCRAIGAAGSVHVDLDFSNPTTISDGEGWIIDLFNGWGPMPNGFMGGIMCQSASSGNIMGTINSLGHNAPNNMDAYTLFEGININ